MLHLHFSNRFERLSDALLDALQAERDGGRHGVLDAQQVIVPSAALRRGLTLAAARRQGVSANLEFSFLAQWLWRQVARAVPQVAADASPFAAPLLTWRVHAAFGDAAFVGWHPRLAGYLDRADDVMRLELARAVAGLLEQTLTYRPDWLQAWSEGRSALPRGAHPSAVAEDEAWQADLWRRIAQELSAGGVHPGQVFVQALSADDRTLELPPSVHVFGLPSTPPLYIPWLEKIARHSEVHLYLLNPCEAYWYEVVDRRRLAHLKSRSPRADTGYHEEGNRLLAAWGKQTQAHVDLLMTQVKEAEEHADFVAHEGAAAHTLLGRLQDAILRMEEPEPASLPGACDGSLEVHVCHSLTRELEVLHDRLLSLFAADPTLTPADVLVVTPDVQAAAPLVEAVFATVPPERHIPFALTGLPRSRSNEVARTLLQLLTAATSRCGVTEVFGLLQQEPIARRFGIVPDDLDTVHAWLQASGARWGLDAAHRRDLGGTETSGDPGRHTLVDGLDRLLLGHALPEHHDDLFDGGARAQRPLLPCGDAEGQAAQLLGRLDRFVEALRGLQRALRSPRTVEAWTALLRRTLADFVDLRGGEALGAATRAQLQEDARALQEDLAALQRDVEAGGQAAMAMSLPVLRAALEQQLDDPARGGVPTGAVTFTAMGTLRGLPYRVVCMIGMNDGAFPTATPPLEFDLMARFPRRGDRQRRHDERNLFLDLLLSARERLLISHTGRSIRDNAPLPPSVLVAELLDVAAPVIATDLSRQAVARARTSLVVEHPLQAFSPQAFQPAEDPRRRSHDSALCAALAEALHARAQAAQRQREQAARALMRDAQAAADDAGDTPLDEHDPLAPPFFPRPLAPPAEPATVVELASLLGCFANPSRALLRQRLGLPMLREDDPLEDAEVFVADGRHLRQLSQRLLQPLRAGTDEAQLHRRAEAGPEMPAGAIGSLQIDAHLGALRRFDALTREALARPTLPPRTLQAMLPEPDARAVRASLPDLRAQGLVRAKFQPLRASDRVEAWLHHLVLCAAATPDGGAEDVAPHTLWILRDAVLRFTPLPPARATALLAELAALHDQALTEPLRFFPDSAWVLVDSGDLERARERWRGSGWKRGEGADPAHALAWRGVEDPLDERFVAVAHAVYDPLRDHLQETALDPADLLVPLTLTPPQEASA